MYPMISFTKWKNRYKIGVQKLFIETTIYTNHFAVAVVSKAL